MQVKGGIWLTCDIVVRYGRRGEFGCGIVLVVVMFEGRMGLRHCDSYCKVLEKDRVVTLWWLL